MPIYSDEFKNNFDTTFVSNYDENGDGTGVNPQPLNVDESGNLNVSIQNVNNGALNTKMFATRDDAAQIPVTCDNEGALNVGGINTTPLNSTGKGFCLAEQFIDYNAAKSGIENLRMTLINNVSANNFTRMYAYTQEITMDSAGRVYVFVSCYGNN